ncbi:MAG: cobalamin biosynthesis protein CobG, partial [Pseudomonadota bacterium]
GTGHLQERTPRLGTGESEEVAEASLRFGSGTIELTSRANLQIRGVTEAGYPDLLARLQDLGLVDGDAALEERRNIVITPFWQPGDMAERLGRDLLARLPDLPPLPAKMGVAVDTGPAPMLQGVSADFRFEMGADGLVLRADGAAIGRVVEPEAAVDALIGLATWFLESGGAASGRMARHLQSVSLPEAWQTGPTAAPVPSPQPGTHRVGMLLGVPFGRMDAAAFGRVLAGCRATSVVCTPWRSLLFVDAPTAGTWEGFVTAADDPRMAIDACVGAPGCASAEVATLALASRLARPGAAVAGGLHVSGCAKGCARPRRAATTLVGREGRFDLVREGAPWDQPSMRGLSADDVMRLL